MKFNISTFIVQAVIVMMNIYFSKCVDGNNIDKIERKIGIKIELEN